MTPQELELIEVEAELLDRTGVSEEKLWLAALPLRDDHIFLAQGKRFRVVQVQHWLSRNNRVRRYRLILERVN